MKPILLIRGGLAAALAVAVSACGFHFAGDRPLPPPLKTVHIELVDPYRVTEPPLQESLQTRIVSRGGVIKSDAADALATLRLFNLREARDVLSFGPDGKAIEYRLVSRISYELRAKDGTELVQPQTQAVTRDYSFSAEQLLPKEAEENRLRAYMQDELAELMLLRIEAQLRAFTPKPGEPVKDVMPAPEPVPEAEPALPTDSSVTPSSSTVP